MPGCRLSTVRLLIAVAIGILPLGLWAENEATTIEQRVAKGAEIYQSTCASCHGGQGEGVADYFATPLVGDLSIGELTKVIDETMPEGEPEQCVGEDAAAVAHYMHQTFYSEAAQLRNRPPRVTLARLTGNQLRQSLADLYAHFHGVDWVTNDRGISAIYFDNENWNDDKKKIERVDPVLDFDFGNDSPGEGATG
jgi:cytochrome c553